jgi:hypothetical protein
MTNSSRRISGTATSSPRLVGSSENNRIDSPMNFSNLLSDYSPVRIRRTRESATKDRQ